MNMLAAHGFPYYQDWFGGDEFQSRHKRVYDVIGHEAVAVVAGAGPVAGFELFRQTNDFFYLTGVEVPQAYLLLDGRARTAVLYLPRGNVKTVAVEGAEPSAEDRDRLIPLTGCADVRGIEDLEMDLRNARIIYTPYAPGEGLHACQDTLRHQAMLIQSDPWDGRLSREAHIIGLIKQRVEGVEIRDLSPCLAGMRTLKSAAELKVMRRTGEIAALGVCETIRYTKPGMFEYQLGAIMNDVFLRNGARGVGYRPTVAGGKNIWLSHYYRNNCVLDGEELVLVDCAPDICNYTSDIGRIWPVSGRYSPVQRELYGLVVAYHLALLKVLRPGVLPTLILREAKEMMGPYMKQARFSKPIYEQAAHRLLDSSVALTHNVGMAVHDGSLRIDPTVPFKPGLVFALDPQLWVPEEQIYIRVEDTVAITETGVENLTKAAPLDLDEMEALIGTGYAS